MGKFADALNVAVICATINRISESQRDFRTSENVRRAQSDVLSVRKKTGFISS